VLVVRAGERGRESGVLVRREGRDAPSFHQINLIGGAN